MPRTFVLLVAALLGAALLAIPAAAQVDIPPIGGGGGSSPTPSPTPTKRLPDPDPEPEPSTGPTKGGGSGGGGSGGGGSGGGGGGKTTKPSSGGSSTRSPGSGGSPTTGAPRRVYGPPSSGAVPKDISGWATREKSPARTTTRLLELIDAARGDGKEASLATRAHAFGRFPVVGYVWYQDDYGAPRYYPTYHPHEGTDLFAVSGTPVIACVDGTIWKWASGGGGGNALWLWGDDGVRYYYGHLKSFAPGVNVLGRRVRMGEVIATVGATGASAAGTYPHVHFEISPGGLGSINPKPVLDAWLRAAESRAAIAAGLLSGPDSFSPSRPSRWLPRLEMSRTEVTSSAAPLWASALGTAPTTSFADLALIELMARDDLTVPGDSGDGYGVLDPLSAVLDPAAHLHAD